MILAGLGHFLLLFRLFLLFLDGLEGRIAPFPPLAALTQRAVGAVHKSQVSNDSIKHQNTCTRHRNVTTNQSKCTVPVPCP